MAPRKVLFRSPASHWEPYNGDAVAAANQTIVNGDAEKNETTLPMSQQETNQTNSDPNSGTATPNHQHLNHHPHFHHAHHGKHMRQFVRPDGRKVHICKTPEEHAQVKRKLAEAVPSQEFEVFIHGTDEHLDAIRELHSHHEKRRDAMRDEYRDVYDQFEHVKTELDILSAELNKLTSHGVSLDANFSKFGYSAHLRTKGEDEESANDDESDNASIHKHQDRAAHALKFWKRPVIKQYFHKGLLWRSPKASEVGSFELFADLLYVGIIDAIGEKALEDPNGKSLVQYSITFLVGWKIWADLTMIMNLFEMDDIYSRLSVLIYLSCLFGFTINMAYAFQSTYTMMMAFYLAERFHAAGFYIFAGFLVPTIKGAMWYQATIVLIAASLWIASIHCGDYPNQLPLMFVAITIEIFAWLGLLWAMALLKNSKNFLYTKYFEFWPAVNIEHRTERTNAFVSLVLGYSVLTILFQNKAPVGINVFFGKGILGLVQAFAFQWIYFEIDHHQIHVHALRRHWFSSTIWMTAHIPFIMGYVLAAATLSQLVLAHDSSDADPSSLGDSYAAKSTLSISTGLRWYYCGGLGCALISMSFISLSHVHKRLPNVRLYKRQRLTQRCFIALIIILLPLAHSHLSSLGLISVTTGLTVFVLAADLYGMSCQGDEFWLGGVTGKEQKASYSAKCHVSKRKRREIQDAMKRGEKVDVQELLKRRDSTSSLASMEVPQSEFYHGGTY